MKKLLSLLLILCLLISMVGCGTGTQETDMEQPTQQPVKDQPSEAFQPGEEAKPTEETLPAEEVKKDGEEQKGNIIPGGSFDESNSMWGIYTESGGKCILCSKRRADGSSHRKNRPRQACCTNLLRRI